MGNAGLAVNSPSPIPISLDLPTVRVVADSTTVGTDSTIVGADSTTSFEPSSTASSFTISGSSEMITGTSQVVGATAVGSETFAASSTSAIPAATNSSANSTSSPPSTGLSSSAKIGLAAGIPIAILVLVALLVLVKWRSYRRSAAGRGEGPQMHPFGKPGLVKANHADVDAQLMLSASYHTSGLSSSEANSDQQLGAPIELNSREVSNMFELPNASQVARVAEMDADGHRAYR